MSIGLEAKIENLQRNHRMIAENLLDAIWVVNAETLNIEYITPSIERISGYAPDEFKTKRLQDRLTPESFNLVETALAEEIPRFVRGVRVIRTLEVELIHKSGTTYWAEIKARFIQEAGQPLKIVGITREIDERKRAEQKQNELIEKLGVALAEKERLLKEIRVLREFLPICSGCKRIRDEHNKWWPLDAYVDAHTSSEITHSICPDCSDVIYGEACQPEDS